jgi:membrane-associated phospholipid phosphatase
MSIADRSRYTAAGFVVLLLLSVFWPAPIVSVNRLWLHYDLSIDELSFLGREQPSWDVVFWWIAGLFAIAVVQSGSSEALRSLRSGQGPSARNLDGRIAPQRGFLAVITARNDVRAGVAGAIAVIAATWFFADRPIVAFAEGVQSDSIDDWIRIANRLGGGINPGLIVLFFLIAGAAYERRTWLGYGIAMAIAGLSAGLFVQILKYIVGRTRPELWLGPFHLMRGAQNSFPSGHTVAAFALGGVLIFGSRSTPLRIIALLLACFIGAARVLAFRHGPSDVVASALISLRAAWVACVAVTPSTPNTPAAG